MTQIIKIKYKFLIVYLKKNIRVNHNNLRHLCFIFLLLSSLCANAQQEIVIRGKVTEQVNNEGIPFVNVFLKGTSIATVTDIEGNYIIKTNVPKDSIYVSLIGYQTETKPVKKGQSQIINFELKSKVLNLGTIEILPGVNPALRIIKKAIENKDKYNRENLQSVQYLSYTKQEVDVDNITDKMRKRKLFKPITSMWDSLDNLLGKEQETKLPVALTEVISEIYSYKEAKKNMKM